MNFRSSNSDDETSIELTPLIDVVFLLLIFFMISTTFTKETKLQINLPEASGEPPEIVPQRVEIQISKESDYAILEAGEEKARVLVKSNRTNLLSLLARYKDKPNTQLIIRADEKASHASVITVMDVAQEVGISNLSFATKGIQE